MSREKRGIRYLLKKQISYINKVYEPAPINVKIPETELEEFKEKLYSREESEITIFENTTEIIIIEKFLVKIYKIYKKNPKDYNKLIELEKKFNYPFVFTTDLKKKYL